MHAGLWYETSAGVPQAFAAFEGCCVGRHVPVIYFAMALTGESACLAVSIYIIWFAAGV